MKPRTTNLKHARHRRAVLVAVSVVALFAAFASAIPVPRDSAGVVSVPRSEHRFLRVATTPKKNIKEGCKVVLQDIFSRKLYKANGKKRAAVEKFLKAKFAEEQYICLNDMSLYEKWDLFRTKKARIAKAKEIADKCISSSGEQSLNISSRDRDYYYDFITNEANHPTADASRAIFSDFKNIIIGQILQGISYSAAHKQAPMECRDMLVKLGCGDPTAFDPEP